MITVDEYRFSKRKTLAVSIDPVGRVIVRAPKGYPQKKIDDFLQKKAAWIESHSRIKRERAADILPSSLDGYLLPFLGGQLRLVVSPVKRAKEESGALYLPMVNPESALKNWLKRQAREIFLSRTIYWQDKMGVRCRSVSVSSAKRRWGSCSGKDEIRYTYRLLYAPMEMIDYVVVHELAHIRHKNHSALFWKEVSAYMPDCFSRRAWLKKHALYLELF